jgi:hypothetical protein
MLINIRVSELINDTNNNIPLGVLAILILFIPLSNLLPDNKILLSKDGMDINSVITNIINKEPLLYVSSYS